MRTGRPPELTCALLEDPEAACPWLSSPNTNDDPHRPTVLSAADVHDALFAFVRRRVREGKTLGEIQAEVDASTRLPSSSSSTAKAAAAAGDGEKGRRGGRRKGTGGKGEGEWQQAPAPVAVVGGEEGKDGAGAGARG